MKNGYQYEEIKITESYSELGWFRNKVIKESIGVGTYRNDSTVIEFRKPEGGTATIFKCNDYVVEKIEVIKNTIQWEDSNYLYSLKFTPINKTTE